MDEFQKVRPVIPVPVAGDASRGYEKQGNTFPSHTEAGCPYQWIISKFAEPGDKIIDTHAGSGSCLVAAYKTQHDFLGFELDEEYFTKADKRIRDLLDIKIYVEADADERILRRVVRDVKERGRDIDNIVEQYLTTVKPMHYLYVEPTRAMADIVINSGMNHVAFDIVRSKIQLMLSEEDIKS